MTTYTLTVIRLDGSRGESLSLKATSLEEATATWQQRYDHHQVVPLPTVPTRWEAAVRS